MFNVGGPEVMVILVVALVVLGPQQLPKAIRSVTNIMNELRKVSSGFQSEIQKVMDVSATETTAREVPVENRQSAPTSGPGSATATQSAAPAGTAPAATPTAESSAPAAEPAAIDPADRAAG